MEELPLTLPALLAFLVSPAGAWLVVTWFFSWALESWQKWHEWDKPTAKKALMVGVALLIAGGSNWLLMHPELVERFSAAYAFLAEFLLGWITLQTAHMAKKTISALQKKPD